MRESGRLEQIRAWTALRPSSSAAPGPASCLLDGPKPSSPPEGRGWPSAPGSQPATSGFAALWSGVRSLLLSGLSVPICKKGAIRSILLLMEILRQPCPNGSPLDITSVFVYYYD